MFKAGNPLGVHKCCICWVAKENHHKTPRKQNFFFFFKADLPRFSCSFTCVCICSAPWWWVLFLKAGVQWVSGTLFWTWWDMFLRAQNRSASRKSSSSGREESDCFFEIDWDLKPEINIHTLHRTDWYLFWRQSYFCPPGSGERVGGLAWVCGDLVMGTKI